jgi:hypothetical protein
MAAAATLVLALHLLWITFVIFGAIWTRRRPVLTAIHLVSLLWGIVVEAGPWPCPLTLLEQHFETLAGIPVYHGSFLLHYLDALIYPNLSYRVIEIFGVTACALNIGVYLWRFWRWSSRRPS